ncbi:hypothetical protein, partial [Salmonella enterica]|uniref:hypothetical protein n=1 Tax=Salmonella enterica TaxID=28901 RepID=UPI0019D524D0
SWDATAGAVEGNGASDVDDQEATAALELLSKELGIDRTDVLAAVAFQESKTTGVAHHEDTACARRATRTGLR